MYLYSYIFNFIALILMIVLICRLLKHLVEYFQLKKLIIWEIVISKLILESMSILITYLTPNATFLIKFINS